MSEDMLNIVDLRHAIIVSMHNQIWSSLTTLYESLACCKMQQSNLHVCVLIAFQCWLDRISMHLDMQLVRLKAECPHKPWQ